MVVFTGFTARSASLCPKDTKQEFETRFAAEIGMGHLEIPAKKRKGPQDYMENNVLTLVLPTKLIKEVTRRCKNSPVIVR